MPKLEADAEAEAVEDTDDPNTCDVWLQDTLDNMPFSDEPASAPRPARYARLAGVVVLATLGAAIAFASVTLALP